MTRVHQLVFQINDTDFNASGALRSRLFDEEHGLNSDMDHFHAVMTPDEAPLYGAIRAGSARYAVFAATDISLLQTAGRSAAHSSGTMKTASFSSGRGRWTTPVGKMTSPL